MGNVFLQLSCLSGFSEIGSARYLKCQIEGGIKRRTHLLREEEEAGGEGLHKNCYTSVMGALVGYKVNKLNK